MVAAYTAGGPSNSTVPTIITVASSSVPSTTTALGIVPEVSGSGFHPGGLYIWNPKLSLKYVVPSTCSSMCPLGGRRGWIAAGRGAGFGITFSDGLSADLSGAFAGGAGV